MAAVRDVISGGARAAAEQLQHEVSALTNDERQELLTSSEHSAQISAEETLAMKADLVLPWRKLRIMRR